MGDWTHANTRQTSAESALISSHLTSSPASSSSPTFPPVYVKTSSSVNWTFCAGRTHFRVWFTHLGGSHIGLAFTRLGCWGDIFLLVSDHIARVSEVLVSHRYQVSRAQRNDIEKCCNFLKRQVVCTTCTRGYLSPAPRSGRSRQMLGMGFELQVRQTASVT